MHPSNVRSCPQAIYHSLCWLATGAHSIKQFNTSPISVHDLIHLRQRAPMLVACTIAPCSCGNVLQCINGWSCKALMEISGAAGGMFYIITLMYSGIISITYVPTWTVSRTKVVPRGVKILANNTLTHRPSGQLVFIFIFMFAYV